MHAEPASPGRLPPGLPPPVGPQTPPAAIASLVLAALALLTSAAAVGIVFGLAAILIGHAARRRIRREAPRLKGAELALGGLLTGYVSVVFGALVTGVVLYPAASRWWNEPTRAEVRRTLAAVHGQDARAVHAAVVRLLGEGHQSAAEQVLDGALRRHGGDRRLIFSRAVLYRSRWSKTAAWRLLSRIRGDRDSVEAQCAELSLQLDKDGSPPAALERLAALAEAHDDDAFVLWLLAIQCREHYKQTSSTRYSQLAADTYERLITLLPVAPVLVHQTYANVLAELGRHEQALAHRRAAVRQEPSGWTYSGLGNTLTDLHRYAEADAAYRAGLARSPGDADYWSDWGNSRSAAGCHDDAMEKFRKAAALEPENPAILDRWGWALERQGKFTEALSLYEKAVALEDGLACNRIGCLYADGRGVPRDYVKARHYYELGTNQMNGVALQNLASLYRYGQGVKRDESRAVALYRQALDWRQDDTPDTDILLYLARCHWEGRVVPPDRGKAYDYYRKAAGTGDVAACNDFVWVYATGGEPSRFEVRDVVARAGKLPRTDSSCVDTLAAFQARQGDFTQAVELQRTAVEMMRRKGVPKAQLLAAEQRLELYQSGRPYDEPANR